MRRYVDPVPALKSQLAREIVACVERPEGVTAASFAIIGGPRLSNLRLSRLDRFSVQGLIRTLTRLGYGVEITLNTPDQLRVRDAVAITEARRAAAANGRGPT